MSVNFRPSKPTTTSEARTNPLPPTGDSIDCSTNTGSEAQHHRQTYFKDDLDPTDDFDDMTEAPSSQERSPYQKKFSELVKKACSPERSESTEQKTPSALEMTNASASPNSSSVTTTAVAHSTPGPVTDPSALLCPENDPVPAFPDTPAFVSSASRILPPTTTTWASEVTQSYKQDSRLKTRAGALRKASAQPNGSFNLKRRSLVLPPSDFDGGGNGIQTLTPEKPKQSGTDKPKRLAKKNKAAVPPNKTDPSRRRCTMKTTGTLLLGFLAGAVSTLALGAFQLAAENC